MRIKRLNYFLVLISLFLYAHASGQADSIISLDAGFKNPPVEARPRALWPWLNGNASLGQITFEMEEAKRKGMGGFDIWDIGVLVDPDNVIPAGPAFLSDKSLHAINHAIREGDRLGLEIGLTFASSWNAGGNWVTPEYGAMGLFRSDTVVTGPRVFSGTIPFPTIPDKYGNRPVIQNRDPKTGLPVFFREVALLAHPLNADSIVNPNDIKVLPPKRVDGKIKWAIPPGKWRIVRYVCAPTGQPLAIPSPNSRGLMLDHFSAAAQKHNLDYIFKRLLPVTGDLRGRSLKYLYADSYEVNSAVWTPLLPEEFQKRKGYSIEKFLPVLDGFHVSDSTTSERFLFDFRKTLSDLIIENHYRLGTEICNDYGIGFAAEAGGPGQPLHNVPFEDLKALGSVSIPRGEFWNKHPQLDLLQVVKGISSAAHLYNKKYVEAESFTSVWLWQEGPNELKPLADRAMCEGLNRFVYHTFPHTPPESGTPGWVYNFGTLINTTNGWWPKSAAFHEYLSRCSYLLQQGEFVADVAYYYGDEAPNFTGPKTIREGLGFGYDYDVVNSEAILALMDVRDNRIVLPHGQSYAVLVLPSDNTSMNPEVLQKLETMIQKGAVVVGGKPEFATGLSNRAASDARVKEIADRIWGTDLTTKSENAHGKGKVVWGKTVRDVLNEMGIGPDVGMKDEDQANVDWIHRRTNSEEIYFVRNKQNAPTRQVVTFRVKGMIPQQWNPSTGAATDIPFYTKTAEGISIPLFFEPYESTFIVFRKGTSAAIESVMLNDKPIYDGLNRNLTWRYIDGGALISGEGIWSWSRDGSKHTVTTSAANTIELRGPWIVRFDKTKNAPPVDTMRTLIPLNESGDERIRHYSGLATYEHTFALNQNSFQKNQRIILELGDVKEIAEVFVNGVNMGTVWHTPFRIDITKAARPGSNTVIIEVVNTINNGLVGDAKVPAEYGRMSSNVKRLPNAWMNPFAEAPLLPAGLIGPVMVRVEELISFE